MLVGTVVFFNGYLLHRSRKNRSRIHCRALVNHYCNSWLLLPWSVAEGESVATADRRSVVAVSGIAPTLEKVMIQRQITFGCDNAKLSIKIK